jgi:HK97 family phage major capsid protein
MTRNERQLKAAEEEMARHREEADAILSASEKEDRDPTDKENREVSEHLKAMNVCKDRISEIKSAIEVEEAIREKGKGISARDREDKPAAPPKAKSLGEQFVESEKFKAVKAAGFSGTWKTGQINLDAKATLLEGELGSPEPGAPLVPSDRRSGVQPILFDRLTVASLLASGTTNSNVVSYVVETVADAGDIGTVAEGAEKPEAELEFDSVDEPVRKIASFLPVSDEMLEDASQIQSYINARLSLFVQQEEENQLLNASGSGTDIDGLLNRIPVGNQDVTSSATAANAADHIYQALTVARASYLEPDGIVVNSDDWAELRLLKDQNENYIGGSPFSNGIGQPAESLWGKRVVVTSAISSGTALVGAFGQAAQVFRRGGLTVEASNSHDDFFRRNLTAIRAEARLALAVYRPQAFATADTSGS